MKIMREGNDIDEGLTESYQANEDEVMMEDCEVDRVFDNHEATGKRLKSLYKNGLFLEKYCITTLN